MICRETNLEDCLDTINRLREMTKTDQYKNSETYRKVVDISLKAHKNLAKRFIDDL